MCRLRLILLLIFVLIGTTSCGKKLRVDGAGFGGSDPFTMSIRSAQVAAKKLLLKLRNGELEAARLCDPRRCHSQEKGFCKPLWNLSDAQRTYASGILTNTKNRDALIDFLKDAEFRPEDRIEVDGEPVEARVVIGGGGPVYFSRSELAGTSQERLMSVWIHEAFHTFTPEGEEGPLLDNVNYSYGFKGYELVTVLGRCVTVVENEPTAEPPPEEEEEEQESEGGGSSQPAQPTYPVDPTPAYAEFGGMFGVVNGAQNVNPVTGGRSCPSGFTASRVHGTTNVDHDVYVCWRYRNANVAPVVDFGGMWGVVNNQTVANPITGGASCPAGYNAAAFSGTSNLDHYAYYCWRRHNPATLPAADFGGAWGVVGRNTAANPVTGGASCPSGHNAAGILYTNNLDYPFYFCWRRN